MLKERYNEVMLEEGFSPAAVDYFWACKPSDIALEDIDEDDIRHAARRTLLIIPELGTMTEVRARELIDFIEEES